MRRALAVWAGGSPFMAIKIAHRYASATGGQVATIQDLFRLFRAQPEHPLFEHFILTDSVLMVGCERRRHRRYPRTHLVHGAGFLTDPDLRTWYDENWKALSPEERVRSQGLRLHPGLWRTFRDHSSAIPLRSMTQEWWPMNRGKRGSIRGSLATQQEAVIGEGCKERRQRLHVGDRRHRPRHRHWDQTSCRSLPIGCKNKSRGQTQSKNRNRKLFPDEVPPKGWEPEC